MAQVMNNISILGSTGSIGTQTLDEINKKREDFRILGLTCNSNIKLLKAKWCSKKNANSKSDSHMNPRTYFRLFNLNKRLSETD